MELYDQYSLILYFFLYSFLGWGLEVIYYAVKERRFVNRGVLNAPICITYGIIMDILIVAMSGRGEVSVVFRFLMCFVIVNTTEYLSGYFARRFMKQKLWQYDANTAYGGRLKGFLLSLAVTAVFYTAVMLLHPPVFLLIHFIPAGLTRILVAVLSVLFAADLLSMFVLSHWIGSIRGKTYLLRIREGMEEQKLTLGNRLCMLLYRRLIKAYPVLAEPEETVEAEPPVFAGGLCRDKIFWVFFICAMLGDVTETFYVHAVSHVWMRRSSLVFGPFSVVWGIGAAILTVVLERFAGKEDRYTFLGGFFLGGTYEYLCSVFTEIVFGTVFWDYSSMPFNIGGRTNLLFMLFWGVLSLFWVKICYPRMSCLIEKIPPVTGKIITWILIFLMTSDMLITMAVMVRFKTRQKNSNGTNVIETFIDVNYPDDEIHALWPNLEMKTGTS